MKKREEIVSAFKQCGLPGACLKCQYGTEREGCYAALKHDVLELLKSQEEQKFFVDFDGKITPLPIQKHGHWEEVQENYDDEQHWQCSVCGCEWYLEAGNPYENDMLYCPECGAKMDEEVKQDAET